MIHQHEGKDYYKAHQYSSGHRKQVLQSKLCGCFYCLEIFSPREIEEWIDNDEAGIGQTALCPKCGVDSIIGSEAGFPLTREFLQVMHDYWFSNKEDSEQVNQG